ncbi:putative ATP-dependent RNA helicase TDRD12 [Leptopilina heterotoma]|uniref:putative ATP-dependent RNA helicase TDRD12 n=1 Tax=Leptopilina heterotoma TaxID=63436 RepID=UPI001CA9F182|nr:putative ATP-dependent RNA helicase TDRD12 [Leptopilina heterotoma]
MNQVIKDESCVPEDAISVKVTSIINPFLMRIYETDNHAFRANAIRKKLEIYAKNNLNFEENAKEMLNLNDSLIVINSHDSEIPAWFCRGILGHMNEDQSKYNVFLPDYGTAFDLSPKNFRKVPKDAIPDDYLTESIALNGIIPASVNRNSKLKGKPIVTIVEKWTEPAICFTRELVGAAKRMYFHPTAKDETEKLFGELYLEIEEEIVLLSRALVFSFFAVKLNKALLKIIYDPDSAEKGIVNKINDNLLIDLPNFHVSSDEKPEKIKEKDFYDSSNSNETGTDEEKNNQDSMAVKTKQKNLCRNNDQEILIRSEYKCKILENLADARYPANIHKVLKNCDIHKPMKIQRYILPAIAKGLDVIAISPASAGKTFGYLLPICSYLATNKLATGKTPTTLVLCSSSLNVDTVASLFQEYLQDYPHINVVAAVNGKPEKTLLAHILNGCQVLVSTAPFLVRFLRKYKRNDVLSLDFSRLRHIILDGGDTILDKYIESVMEIFIKHKVMREKHDLRDNDLSLQMIAVAREWTKGLSSFMEKFTVFPYVCIGSYLEAAAFSRITAKVSLLRMEEKNEKVLETVNNSLNSSIEKTLIICTSSAEVIELKKLLEANGKTTLVAHNELLTYVIHDIKRQWSQSVSGMYPILICTDDVLSDLNIKDAKCLIHQSINASTKSRFYYRFSTMSDNWQTSAEKCKVFIMMDSSNNKQFNGLMEVMKRLHAPLPKDWIHAAKKIALSLDKEKRAYPICDNVKAMGFCQKNSNCSYRHCILSPEDDPNNDVEIGDKVELMVTFIHNASHFSARLVKCYKPDQKDPIEYPSDVKLSIEMHKFFSSVENRKGLKDINVGDICAMEDNVDNYLRVKVLKIVSRNDYDEPYVVTVKFIDYQSDLINVKASKLLEIPKNLGQWETNNFDVFLNNLEAFDKEYEWDKCADKAAADWFETFFTSKCTVIAKVNLHLKNTFWVNTLEIRTKMAGYPEFLVSSLRSYLLENNHAIENNKHLPELYQLCKNGKLKFKEVEEDFNSHEQVA